MAEIEFEIDDNVDITDVVCPTTFVKAKVALEELDDGQILAVKMNDGEPVQKRAQKHQGRGSQNFEAHKQRGRHLHTHRKKGG